jgi:hypothetical protein
MNNFNEYTLTFTAHIVARHGDEIKMREIQTTLEKRLITFMHEIALVGATKLTLEDFE